MGFLLIRLLALFVLYDQLHRVDELYAGAVLLETLAGRGPGLANAAFDAYTGGSLLVSLAALPAFLTLGPSMFSLKTVALFMSTAVFLLSLRLVERLYGARTMRLLGLLFVIAPPEYVKLNLMAWGNHAESTVPGLAALLCLFGLCPSLGAVRSQHDARRELMLAFACGLLATFAVFLSLAALIFVATIVIVTAVLGPQAWRRRTLVFLCFGAMVGLLPWVAMNLALRFHGFSEIGRSLRPRLWPAAAKVVDLLTYQLPRYLAPHLGLQQLLEAGFGAIVLACWLALSLRAGRTTRRGRIAPELFLVLPPVLFVFAYAVSGFGIPPMEVGVITYHYLPPITPFLLACLAVFLSRLRALAWPLAIVCVLPNAMNLISELPKFSTLPLRLSGASYFCYGWNLPSMFPADLDRQLAWARRIPQPDQRQATIDGIAVGFNIDDRVQQWVRDDSTSFDRLISYLDRTRVAGDDQRLFVRRLALGLGSAGGHLRLHRARFQELLGRLSGRPSQEVGPIIRAAVVDFAATTSASPEELVAVVEALDDSVRGYGYEALGMISSRRIATHETPPGRPSAGFAGSADAGENARRKFDEGFGFDWAWLGLVHSEVSDIPPELTDLDKAAAERGVQRALELFESDDPIRRQHLADKLGLAKIYRRTRE